MPDPDITRRDFVLHASAALAAAAVPAGAAFAADASTPAAGGTPLAPPDRQPPGLPVPPGAFKKLGYAVVGLGELALEEVLPAFGLCQHSRPTALVSGHPDKARRVAEYYGIDAKHLYGYEAFDRIKDDPAIDVVYIILPNHLHAEYTVRGLRAGKHVLCEKPLAATVAEARQMCRVAEETGRKFATAYRLRYEPFNQKAIAVLRSGELGKIRTIEAQNMQDVKPPNIRLSRQTAGGPLGDVGLYCLNACRYLTGEEPAEASAMVHRPADDPRFAEVPENVAFQLKFPSGVLAVCKAGFGSQESRQFRVVCSEGWLELQNAFAYRGQRMLVSKGKEVREPQVTPLNHFAAEMDGFSRAVLDDKPVPTPGEEGLRDMAYMAWIDEAARTGQRVRITDAPPNADKVRETAP